MQKHYFLIFFLVLLTFSAKAQNKKYRAYIYKITDKQAQEFYKKNYIQNLPEYCQNLIDSFPQHQQYNKELSKGHYLFVKAESNKIKYNVKSVNYVDLKLFDNQQYAQFLVHDSLGNVIEDVEVFAKKKKLKYEKVTQTHWLNSRKKRGLLTIKHKNTLSFFRLDVYFQKSRLKYKILYDYTPAYKVWNPATNLYHAVFRGRGWKRLLYYLPFYTPKSYYQPSYKGYFITNKPKYRPNDTLKLKAFITEGRKRKPYKKDLYVYLNNKKIGQAKSYRKGAYTFDFVLEEKLKLTLDKIQYISLKNRKGKNVNSTNFYYEDYELDNNIYKIRAEKEEIYSGQNLVLYAEGKDANDLNLLDGNVELTLLNKSYPFPKFDGKTLFIPDTIWTHQQKLDILGETKIVVPDSIFPEASFSMTLLAKFSNADGETKEETLTINRKYEKERLILTLENGFIQAKYLENNQSKTRKAILKYEDIEKEITLPYKEKINPFVWEYEIESEDLYTNLRMNNTGDELFIKARKSRDSLFVTVDNPHKIPFHYSIFINNKVIQGQGTNIDFKDKSRKNIVDKVVLNYIWAGEEKKEEQTLPFYEKMLNVAVKQDQKVYPGQETEIELSITDQKQNPVENVDVSAFAYTSKFKNAKTPNIDYLGKPLPLPLAFRPYKKRDVYKNGDNYMSDAEFLEWNKKLGLDSLEYYRLLYPKNGFYQTTLDLKELPNLPKNIKLQTQFIPFVVSGGYEQNIHLIYVDDKLVYVRNNYQTYALPISEGEHNIKIATKYHLIHIDKVFFEKGKKTIFSLNVHKENKRYKVEKYWKKWAKEEESILEERTLELFNNYKNPIKYLVSGDKVFQKIGSGTYHFAPFSKGDTIYCYNEAKELIYKTIFEPYLRFYYDDKIAKFQNRNVAYRNPKYPKNKTYYNNKDIIYGVNYQTHLTWEQIKKIPLKVESLRTKIKVEYDYQYKTKTTASFGKLHLSLPYQKPTDIPQIKHFALAQNKKVLAEHIYPKSVRVFHQIKEGQYTLFIIADSNRVMRVDDIDIKANGITYLKLDSLVFEQRQEKIDIHNLLTLFVEEKNKPVYVTYHKDLSKFTGDIIVSGKVTDEKGNGIPSASVFIKGSNEGVVTDIEGYYKIRVSRGAILVFKSVGMPSQEVLIGSQRRVNITLHSDVLEAVIKTGYSVERVNAVSYSTIEQVPMATFDQVLQGQAPGLLTNSDTNAALAIRGVSGVIIGQLGYKETDNILLNSQNQNLLSEANLQAVKVGGIRSNFRDYAYWKPQLRTDDNGKVKFKVKYPDDVTKWTNYFIAMDGKRHSGFTSTNVLAYKDIMGQLAMPRFLTEGDTVQVIGKSLNYGADTLAVKTVFEQNDKVLLSKKQKLVNSLIDKLPLVASQEDSLSLKYYLETEENYQEGEKRQIPIFPQGTLETKGQFLVLEKDTSFSISGENPRQKLKVSALANDFEVLLREIRNVRRYQHLCNEQRASKIKTLLAEEKIRAYLGEKFKHKKLIQKLVTSLEKIQNTDGTWGWWSGFRANYWISAHVVEALLQAEKAGYKVSFNKSLLINHLGFQLEESYLSFDASLKILNTLKDLGETLDYKKYIKRIEKKALERQDSLSIEQNIKLIALKQKLALKYDIKDILKAKKETMLGQVFWGKEGYHIYNNAIQTSLQVYQILEKEGKYARELQGIKNYIFSRRKGNAWRNTFESAQIIERLLPKMLKKKQRPEKSFLYVNNKKIENYPFEAEFSGQEKVDIKKEGDFPIYFSSYQQDWNKEPRKNEKDFKVKSYFEGKPKQLEVSEKIDLVIEIENDKSAEFVMIEVPIPAGCSYAEKPKNYYSTYHREYYKNKVCIFTEKLPIGKHTFKVSLMPRYAGNYTLNPARVELMYFPVFFGREALKKVEVQSVEAKGKD